MEKIEEKPPVARILSDPVSMKTALLSLLERETLALKKPENSTERRQEALVSRRKEMQRLLRKIDEESHVPTEVYEGFEKLIF